MLKQFLTPFFASWEYVYREHASLRIHTPLIPLLAACDSAYPWSVRDAYICRTALDANPSYRPATNETLVQLDIMPDICGASNARNNDNAPSECPLSWSETTGDWWRRANYGWNISPRIGDAVFWGNESWHDVSIQGDWMQVRKTLECIEGISGVDLKAKSLNVLVKQPETCSYPSEYVGHPVPTLEDVKNTTDAVLRIMHRFSNLHILGMQIPDTHNDWFEKALSTTFTSTTTSDTTNTTTTGIISLILGPFTHPLIAHTPHLTRISLHEWSSWGSQVPQDALIAVIQRSALPVEHLELKEIWKGGNLATVAQVIPGLKSLEIGNAVVDLWGYDSDLKELIPGLSLFTNLTTLSLPPEQALDPDYNPPWCGTIYVDNPGYMEEVDRQHDAALKRLLETVRTELPVVERVRFGGGKWYDLR